MITKEEHKIAITKISIFCILFLILCYVMNYLTMPYLSGDSDIIAGFYGERENSLDVVYIGGSASFVYFQPLTAYEKYGFTTYDFGANTIQADFYPYMIKEIKKTQKPKLIIIDARAYQYRDEVQPPSDVNYRNVLTGTPLSKEKSEFIEANVRDVLKSNDTLSYYFSFIRFHSADAKYSKVQGLRMMLRKYKQEYKGFMLVAKHERQKFLEYETEEENVFGWETHKMFEELLDTLKGIDSKVLFIVSPYVEKKDQKKIYNYVERRVKEEGYDFIDANDYNEEMNISFDTDFYNYNHVNIFGSNKYTDFLCKYIRNTIEYEDHRSKPEYQDWELALDHWNEEKKKTIEATNKELELIKWNEEAKATY